MQSIEMPVRGQWEKPLARIARQIVFTLLAAAALPAQTAPVSATAVSATASTLTLPTPQVPVDLMYRFQLHRVAWIADLADQEATKNPGSIQFRTFLKRQYGLTDFEQESLFAAARRLRLQEAPIRERIGELKKQYRDANMPNGQLALGQKIAPAPAELHALFQQLTEVTLDLMQNFHDQVGDIEFVRIQAALRHNMRIEKLAQAAEQSR